MGLSFNLGKTNFDRHSTITPVVIPVPFTTEQYNALKDKVAALEKENSDLKNKVAALEKEVAPLRSLVNGQTYLYENGTFTAVDVKAGAPVSIYFDLGSAKISAREKAHLEYFTNNIATADTKVEVNGYADKATGSAKTNQALSEKRAKAVVDLLKKAGMPESNIVCKANGGVDIFNTPAYKNRVVTIEIK
jgi:outer membrane protein OmpA-like peptidoglycan-associated protein